MDEFLLSKEGPSQNNVEDILIQNELTQKFLRGEITFNDYSSEWYSKDDDDEIDDEDASAKTEDDDKYFFKIKEKIRRRRKITKLSAALIGLMGEANIRFVRGEKEVAEKMCYEIIRQVPTAPEPYHTLAQIYESDPEKSLQFSLLAAHLSPSDAHEWLRLAALSKQRNDIKQEMVCYTQAIKADQHNLAIHMKRLELLTEAENINFPISTLHLSRVKCYHTIVTSLLPSEGAEIMKYAKLAAKLYHNNDEIERALEVMEAAYKKCSHLFSMEDVNLFLELLINRKQYETCLEVFVSNIEVEIEAEIQTIKEGDDIKEQTHYLSCQIPNNLPIDLKSKLLISFIHLGAFNLVNTLIVDFLNNDVEKAGDLFMDVEEALSAVGKYDLALKMLETLVENKAFDLGAVWLKHADCLAHLNRNDEAIESYYKVLKHAPQHTEAREKLFLLLENKKSIDQALSVLDQDRSYLLSAKLLYQQCLVLKRHNRLLKYLEVAETLLMKTFVKFRYQEELRFARSTRGLDLLYNFRTLREEVPYNSEVHFDEDESFKLSPTEEWELYKELLQIAFQNKKYYIMERLTFGALMSKSLSSYRSEIEYDCLQACIFNKDYVNVLPFIKELVNKASQNQHYNLYNLFGQLIDNGLCIKVLWRLWQKKNESIITMFLGNSFLTSNRYATALKHYIDYYEDHKEPLCALLIATSLLNKVHLRPLEQHHLLMMQGMSYMQQYRKLRNCDQEVYYNFGRVYQSFGMNNLAMEYYEKALSLGPVMNCKHHGSIDLTKEIAYNLYLLYKDQSPKLALKYMMEYLVIE